MLPLKRLPRIERDSPAEVPEDENAHLWAVSYSDFLMALLSFFILFFSMDDQSQSQLLVQLSEEFSNSADKTQLQSIEKQRDPNSELRKDNISVQGLNSVFKELNLETDATHQRFIIDFPKDFFKNGQYAIPKKEETLVVTVLNKLKPYEKDIKIYFEGHTDDKPSHKKINTLVIDNFLLSSLRASNALLIAKNIGFQENNMFIQAASSHKRNTRSLSMHIVIDSGGRQ